MGRGQRGGWLEEARGETQDGGAHEGMRSGSEERSVVVPGKRVVCGGAALTPYGRFLCAGLGLGGFPVGPRTPSVGRLQASQNKLGRQPRTAQVVRNRRKS